MEMAYPGILQEIRRVEDAQLPACVHCKSTNTADVQCGVIGRTILIARATTKFFLVPNRKNLAPYYCWSCKEYFSEKI